MDLFFEKIIKNIGKPIIEEEYIQKNHLILSKYTSKKYYQYTLDLLKILLDKSDYKNKKYIFHMSLYYLLKILYNFKNNPYIKNYDLLILYSFSLGVKVSVDIHKTPFITKTKNLYHQKFSIYTNDEIQKYEIICLKLLDYNINILTSYEILSFLFQNDNQKLSILIKKLEIKIFNNVNEILFKYPYDLVKEIINEFDLEINQNSLINEQKLITLQYNKDKKIINETASTMSVSSSYGSLQEQINFNYNKKLKGIESQNIIFNHNEINSRSLKDINIINNIKKENNNNYFIKDYNNKSKKNHNLIFNKFKYNNNSLYNKELFKMDRNKKYINIKSKSNDLSNYSNKNNNTIQKKDIYISKNIKMNHKKFLCFSDKRSNIKIKNNINLDSNINNSNFIEINNINKSNENIPYKMKEKKNSLNSIFKKPILYKNKIKNKSKNFEGLKKDLKLSKLNYVNSILKNCNINYINISDLCKNINFNAFIEFYDKSNNNQLLDNYMEL